MSFKSIVHVQVSVAAQEQLQIYHVFLQFLHAKAECSLVNNAKLTLVSLQNQHGI